MATDLMFSFGYSKETFKGLYRLGYLDSHLENGIIYIALTDTGVAKAREYISPLARLLAD